jgi:transposase-like protein
MSRKRYSEKDKQKAVQMLLSEQYTQKQVAEKFGCSVGSLLTWRDALQEEKLVADMKAEAAVMEAKIVEEEEQKRAQRCQELHLGKVHELKKLFWGDDSRAVNMLLTPADITPNEVVKLVNEALEYAYNHAKK